MFFCADFWRVTKGVPFAGDEVRNLLCVLDVFQAFGRYLVSIVAGGVTVWMLVFV